MQPAITCNLSGCGCAENPFIWVSEKLGCLYYEIPKNASSSIKEILNRKEFAFYQVDAPPGEVRSRYGDFYAFAVLREPLERFLSNYRMFCLSRLDFRHRQIEALFNRKHEEISLHDFVEMSEIWRNHHWELMVKYLPMDPANKLGVRLEKIALLETLDVDWDEIRRNLDIDVCLPRINRTTAVGKRKILADEDEAILMRRYADDINFFGHVKRQRESYLT